jgi:flagellar biosynthesis protein FliR
LSIDHIVLAFLIASRLTGLILTMPVLGLSMFPTLIKAFMLMGLTAVILPTVPFNIGYISFGETIIYLGMEFLLGALVGFMIMTIFHGLLTATEMMSTQIGQAAAKQFNPSMSISQSPIGGMALFLAMAIFLGNNQHLQMIQILADSFQYIPPTKISNLSEAGLFYVEHTTIIFDLAVKISAPVLLFVFLNNCFLAMLAKLAPNMNVFFSVGFQVSMMGGLVIFYLIIPHFLELSQLAINDYILLILDILALSK